METLQVYVLSRDRPVFLKQAIDSILNQQIQIEFELIISDNSVGDEVKKMIDKSYSQRKFKYYKVNPTLSA